MAGKGEKGGDLYLNYYIHHMDKRDGLNILFSRNVNYKYYSLLSYAILPTGGV